MNTLIHAATAILIHVPSMAEVHPATRAAHAGHRIAWRWLSGQLWAWEGGDAITVITGDTYGSDDHRVYFFIRIGSKVHEVVARSFKEAMEGLGYQTAIDTGWYERLDASASEASAGGGL